MATPPLSDAVLRDAIERVEEQLKLGYRPKGMTGRGPGAIEMAGEKAAADGILPGGRSSMNRRLEIALERGMEPDWSLYRPARYQQPIPRQVFQPAPPVPQQIKANGTRILVIGDLHQNPGQPHRLEVLTLIARYASLHRFERIIQVGDWSSWDSVSAHDRNDTFAGRLKPSIKQDMDNLAESLMAFRRGMAADYKPKLTFLNGNHEYRLERWENQHPESVGIHTGQRDQLFLQFGWQARPYGEIFYVEGVGFVHHPVNGAGRAFGGKTGPQRAANDAVCPIVSGHTHRRQIHDSPKIGPTDSISMVEVGCGMPWGELEHYAQHSATGWWWGVVPMTVQDGMITDVQFVSMLSLQALAA